MGMCTICLNDGKEADVAGDEPRRGYVIGSRSVSYGWARGQRGGLCRFHRASQTKARTWIFTLSEVRARETFEQGRNMI